MSLKMTWSGSNLDGIVPMLLHIVRRDTILTLFL